VRNAELLLVAAFAAAGPGCGKSKDRELFENRRAICLGLPASGANLNDAAREFGPVCTVDCRTNGFGSVPGNQACPLDGATEVCRVVWEWIAVDQSLCGPFGCAYFCELWVEGPPSALKPFCGVRFFDEQPGFLCG
jgi:hypothetical protein